MNKALFFTLLTSIFLITACSESKILKNQEKDISEYVTSNNLTITEKTSSGLVYIRTAANSTGASLVTGQNVTVNYAGRLLNDAQFDAGTFTFVLGIGQVVAGFDEGIAKMKVGEKATIIFPSSLGYGAQAQGSIPKNSPLIFDIEIVSAR